MRYVLFYMKLSDLPQSIHIRGNNLVDRSISSEVTLPAFKSQVSYL